MPILLRQWPSLFQCCFQWLKTERRFNWTYRDLLTVIRPGLKRPEAYPCERDQDFATYCANSLGLKKTGKGATAQNGLPKGSEIAQEFCPGLKAKAEG